jgi:hypothetical protein
LKHFIPFKVAIRGLINSMLINKKANCIHIVEELSLREDEAEPVHEANRAHPPRNIVIDEEKR